MTKFIIGKESLLTKNLIQFYKNSKIFSSRNSADAQKIIEAINNSSNKIELIMNNFYPSALIHKINKNDYLKFYEQSILFNAKIFSEIDAKKISKIVYSSSSSVYNSIRKDYQKVDLNNKNLYSSTKIAVENLIYNFCSKNNIPYLILRIFNMYSTNSDKFSILSKLKNNIKTEKKINIFNQGQNIRDYIDVKDVVKLYDYFINKKKLNNRIYDIGTGRGTKLIDIIEFLGKNKFNLNFINKKIDEVDVSIASNDHLNKFNFINLENFFKKLKNNKKKIYHYKPNNANILQDIIEQPIIYGTGNAGEQVYKALINQNIEPYCFVDDNKKKHNELFFGKKIISSKELETLSKIKIINKLIIAIPSLKEKKLKFIKKKFSKLVNDISFIPLKNILRSEIISLTDLINYETEQILGKKKRVINYNSFRREFRNKQILVTGGAGSIGSQLIRQLIKTNCKKIIAYDNSEIDLFNLKEELKLFKDKIKLVLGDINDKDNLSYELKKEKVDFIFHTAAYKHVGILEENVQSAIRNNIFGTQSVLDVAKILNIPIITISTDKAVKASNILGLTKRISEILCLNYNDNNFSSKVVRFGNVFGSVGSAVPTFIKQINNKLPITITNKKVKRYFMTLNEACFLLMTSIKIKNAKNVIILKMGKPIKIIKIISSLINLRKKIDPTYTFTINEIGLQKGEKLSEELSINKRLIKTKYKDISIAKDPLYNNHDLIKLIISLKENLSNPLILINLMKNFLSKDFTK